MNFNLPSVSLDNLSHINVVLGKNGCGKSYLLKKVEQGLAGQPGVGRVRYISPERGGFLKYEANIDQNISNSSCWMDDVRRRNQSDNFRQQSTVLFRRLELSVLREIETEQYKPDYLPITFSTTIDRLNTLLDRVRLERDSVRVFRLLDRSTGAEAAPEEISSGESELISLGIEFLTFAREAEAGKHNVLLVDEPDVHLHPDLQARLARFMLDTFRESHVTVVLATHSTALLAGLASAADTTVAFMRRGQVSLDFKTVTDTDRSILPIFGAHPLSNVFNQSPIFLVEGEDDERMWQQAVRTSQGRLRCFPCPVDSISRMAEYEREVCNIIESVYDDARAYSLRDRDTNAELIDDLGAVRRMRLSCRSAENLMLSDTVLRRAGSTWNVTMDLVRDWMEKHPNHPYQSHVEAFATASFPRKDFDLKEIRNILASLMTNKPWEVLVGQAIAAIATDGEDLADGSLRDFLGEKLYGVIRELSGRAP